MQKKILTVTSVLFFLLSGVLGIMLYQAKTPKEPARCPNLPYDYNNSDFEGIIGYQTAQALYTNYGKDSAKAFIKRKDESILDKFIVEEDTRSVWFSLERLKNFIWHIEQQNCANGCNNVLGLRIYFAKYPNFSSPGQGNFWGLDDVPRAYANHHTLFMVPTYQDINKVNVDFYPGGKTCGIPFAQSPKIAVKVNNEVVDSISAPSPYVFMMGILEDAQNHGGLIPPGDPAGTSFPINQ